MKTLLRGFGPAFLVGAFLGLVGCAPDNETEAQRNQAKLGEIPKSEAKGDNAPPPTSSSYDEYAARRKKDLAKDPRDSDYAKKAGGGSTRAR